MAHPKRKISRTRRDKRRTHDALPQLHLTTCPVTGEAHEPHRAYWHDRKLYYRGKLLLERAKRIKKSA